MDHAKSEQKLISSASADVAPIGRDFRDLSIHPNSDELFLVEVNEKKLPEHSRVLRYNLKQNTLQHYVLPEGYAYTDAKISPSGNYIVMKRVKEVDLKDETKIRETLSDPEIAIMKTDGTDFRALKLSSGYKHGPILSNDDSKIAYWRGALRPPHSKSLASFFDIWEVDLKTGSDTLFAGNFEFFEGAQMQYLPGDDEILFHAYGPRVHAQSMSSYDKRYNHSHTYKASRGLTTLPEPILTEVYGSALPLIDRAGNLYFEGAGNDATSLLRKSPQEEIKRWIILRIDFASLFATAVAPNGAYIAFIYPFPDTRPSEGKRGIGMLDTQISQWGTLSIPPLESSSPIVVKLAQ